MSTITTASRQWASRPDDERFCSVEELHSHCVEAHERSKAVVVPNRRLELRPDESDEMKGLKVFGPNGAGYAPTHWSFGQLASLAKAPAHYLRTLPAPLVADNLNFSLRHNREIEDVGVLLRKPNGHEGELAAVTGPRYGRIWNHEITEQLRRLDLNRWTVPGEFGKAVTVTKANTTLYASDRDMFVFLADEQNRIVLPNRRNGEAGSLARGFFVWNSEVGSKSIGVAFFLFDYVCCNRMIWGAEGYKEITLRHTVSAPDRWLEEVEPALLTYQNAAAEPIENALKAAQAKKVDDLGAFLKKRNFNEGMKAKLEAAFEAEENGKIETLWDAATAMTAYAKTITYQDDRVALEREAGKLIDLAA